MKLKPVLLERKLLSYSLTTGAILAAHGNINATHNPVIVNQVINSPDGTYSIDFDGGGNDIRITFRSAQFLIASQAGLHTTVKFIGQRVDAPSPFEDYFYGKPINSSQSVPVNPQDLNVNWQWGNRDDFVTQGTQSALYRASLAYKSTSNNAFRNQSNKFLGVRIGTNPNFHYAWVQLSITSNTSSATIVAYAYETDLNTPIQPLPVELTSFSAINLNNAIKLNWTTASEVNNYGFEIERTPSLPTGQAGAVTPGQGIWEKIGFVKGAGNSSSEKVYSFTDQSPLQGDVLYRLKQIDNDGKFTYSKELLVNLTSPLQFTLGQNYPNPFNPVTNIHFTIPESGEVTLKVYNSIGEQVADLVNGFLEAGIYSVDFKDENLPSGVYIYRLEVAGKFSAEKKMNLIK